MAQNHWHAYHLYTNAFDALERGNINSFYYWKDLADKCMNGYCEHAMSTNDLVQMQKESSSRAANLLQKIR